MLLEHDWAQAADHLETVTCALVHTEEHETHLIIPLQLDIVVSTLASDNRSQDVDVLKEIARKKQYEPRTLASVIKDPSSLSISRGRGAVPT